MKNLIVYRLLKNLSMRLLTVDYIYVTISNIKYVNDGIIITFSHVSRH